MKKGNASQQVKQGTPKILGRVTIDILDNNSVTVNGPINEPALMLDIFAKAMAAIAQHIAGQKQESNLIAVPQRPGIVVPTREKV